MEDSFADAKEKWHNSHASPDFKVVDFVLESTTNLNNIKLCKNLKYSFVGPFVIKALHGENAVELKLSKELSNKHPTFQHIPPVERSSTNKATKFLKERKLRTKKLREYLVRYIDPLCENYWLAEKYIPEATKLLRRFRNPRKNHITK
ncbi:hypothetical protein O181_108002 [Austropuccinia psidii MF-1]|uniref:Uncharacterized protein n=1 Tax=Austropuccinia psidii MF-1 TaxID=1389203 RepID=A0A9Q3JTE4_9BASI|nr:hypothetical protein [Austropuccinia psidii MF-1]